MSVRPGGETTAASSEPLRVSELQDDDWREIICPQCGGEGMWESAPRGYNHIDGSLLTETVTCETCGGSGGIWEQCEPVTMEDLAAIPVTREDDPYSAFAYRGGNP